MVEDRALTLEMPLGSSTGFVPSDAIAYLQEDGMNRTEESSSSILLETLSAIREKVNGKDPVTVERVLSLLN
jgi:hypothetical protein